MALTGIKKCVCCKIEKDFSEFTTDKRSKDSLEMAGE